MADRRMINRLIVTEDRFLSMPTSTQLLYAMLIVGADDEGFIDPGATIRMYGVERKDLEILVEQGYLFYFPSGAVCVKDWNVHNTIRPDRLKKSRYKTERSLLEEADNNVYYLKEDGKPPA